MRKTSTKMDLPDKDDPDRELWLLRVPANVDVKELLDGVRLESLLGDHGSSGDGSGVAGGSNVLSRFRGAAGSEYAITRGEDGEADGCRVLTRDESSDEDDDEEEEEGGSELSLSVSRRIARTVHLTSVVSDRNTGDGIQSELALAPPAEDAPRPANRVRLAYAPVPQREGLKRRWQMFGSGIRGEAGLSAIYSRASKRAKVADVPAKEVEAVEDERAPSPSRSSRKDKKKKEKKSKKVKSPKKK
ncbi:hypothetical protein THAOC_19036 [Thalassiosira oceanica]|uniref:Uncharacterized protein n=1 Tax=Thalassiosira oceanica TaxID=159749 RepID=K0S6N3_THAOC|nr:hypothetical protein THAOC_19036 [Thalassiosira oceanica]|eukprot:EJK60579.1 hypothetical protein THAOC_19036 [Thalassiosira oceanica]